MFRARLHRGYAPDEVDGLSDDAAGCGPRRTAVESLEDQHPLAPSLCANSPDTNALRTDRRLTAEFYYADMEEDLQINTETAEDR